MAPLIPIAFQAIAVAVGGSLGLGALATALIAGAAALVGGYVSGKFASQQKNKAREIRANVVSTDSTIPVVYGKRLIGSNDVFIEMGTRGEGVNSGNYMWIVHVLCEGEIEGINQINIGTEADPIYEDEIYINNKGLWELEEENPKISSLVKYWVYTGSPTQTHNTNIEIATRDGEAEKFTDAMRNTAYIVFRFYFGKKSPFTSVPSREVVIKGIKCFDSRTATVAYTTNPALILLNYLTEVRYGVGWPYSTVPGEANLFDKASFDEAATYCDTIGWSLNYVISGQLKAQALIDDILSHFRGALYWYDGELTLRYMDLPLSPVFYIYDEHIARDSNSTALVTVGQPSKFDTPDGAVVTYVNPRDNWTSDRVQIGDKEGQIKAMDFPGFTDRSLAREMGTYLLERQRLNRSYTLSLRPDTVALDTHDLISVTSSELALNDQIMRVQANSVGADGMISVLGIIESETLYDTFYEPDTSQIYSVDLASRSDAPPSVENITVTEEDYYTREVSYIRLNISFDKPSGFPYFDHVDVYVAYADPVTKEPPLDSEYKVIRSTADNFQIDPAEEYNKKDMSGHYYIRLNSVSSYGISQTDEDAAHIEYRVEGVDAVSPPCPTYLNVAVNASSVDLIATVEEEPDIKGYEIRLGEAWSKAIFLSFVPVPSISFNAVKPSVDDVGAQTTHKFWMNTQHKNGRYCATPKSNEAIVVEPPPGSYLFFEEVVNYATGTGVDVTWSGTYPNQTMQVDHSGNNLEGSYTSTVIDTGNENIESEMLVYALFDFSVTTTANTWRNLAPYPITWREFAQIDPIGDTWKTWAEILGDPTKIKATKLFVSLDYSDSPSGPWYPDTDGTFVDRLELLTVIVKGRYIRVRYFMEDVSLTSTLVIEKTTIKAAYLSKSLLIRA